MSKHSLPFYCTRGNIATSLVYRHYKGNKYLVLGLGKHSETLELMVLYVTLYENKEGALWCRPASIWNQEVKVGRKKVKRFTLVK